MPEESEEKEEREGPAVEPDEFTQLASLFQQQLGLSDRQQAATMLGSLMKDAGVGQDQAEGVLSKMARTLNEIPSDMPMSRASADQKLSQEIMTSESSGGVSRETLKILEPYMPYVMAFKILDMFSGNQRSGIENLLLKETVKEKFGEGKAGGDMDQMLAELKSINRGLQSGNVGQESAIDRLSEQAEELQKQMDTFGNVAKTMGYSPENQGSLEKLADVSEQFKEILGNLRESVPSRSSAPQKEFSKAEEQEKPEKTKIPVEEESGGSEGEKESPKPKESKGRERDEKGRFVSEAEE